MPVTIGKPHRTTKHHSPKVKTRPRWTIDVKTTDRFEWEVYEAMVEWVAANVPTGQVHRTLAGGRSIAAITFPKYTDAMLFYVRFI